MGGVASKKSQVDRALDFSSRVRLASYEGLRNWWKGLKKSKVILDSLKPILFRLDSSAGHIKHMC